VQRQACDNTAERELIQRCAPATGAMAGRRSLRCTPPVCGSVSPGSNFNLIAAELWASQATQTTNTQQ
jgi:hypothetical protein